MLNVMVKLKKSKGIDKDILQTYITIITKNATKQKQYLPSTEFAYNNIYFKHTSCVIYLIIIIYDLQALAMILSYEPQLMLIFMRQIKAHTKFLTTPEASYQASSTFYAYHTCA